jgi:hypothetical protein
MCGLRIKYIRLANRATCGWLDGYGVEFLSDGGEDVRNVQLYLNPQTDICWTGFI